MDAWSTLALLRRYRAFVAILLLIGLGGSVVAVGRIARFYEASARLVLLVPAEQSPVNNPFLGIDSFRVLTGVVTPIVTSAPVVKDLKALGANTDYTVDRDTHTGTPTLEVVARDHDPARAARTVALVSDRVRAEVEQLQARSGAPQPTWIEVVPLASPNPVLLPGSRIRALGGLLLATLMVALGLTMLRDARRRARARPASGCRPGEPPWVALVGADSPPQQSDTPLDGRQPQSGSRRSRPGHGFDAVSGLTVFVVLLFGLPARLVFKPLGAAGTPATLWGVAMLCWWAAHHLAPAKSGMRFQPVRLGVQVLGAVALASYSVGFFRPISGAEVLAADRALISLAAWSGIALLAADGIATRERLNRFLQRFATAGAVLASLGIVQFFTAVDIRPWFKIPGLSVNGTFVLVEVGSRAGFSRVSGTADHPIEFSVVLALLLPLALHLAFHGDPARRRSAWLRVGLIAAAIPLSVSRTGILCLAIGGIIQWVAWPARRRWRAILMLPVAAVPAKLLVPGLIGSIRGMFLHINSDTSFTGRTEDYKVVTRFFLRSPFIGRGWGTFLPDRYILLDNQFLGTLVEAGLLGILALLIVFALGMGAARGARRRAGDAAARDLGQALTASIAAAMISFVTFDAFSFSMASGSTFLLIGCAGALWRLTLPQAGAESNGVDTDVEEPSPFPTRPGDRLGSKPVSEEFALSLQSRKAASTLT